MNKLIESAWAGWLEYISYGKYAALFLGAVLFMWVAVPRREAIVLLERFGALTGFLVICPLTAAMLMIYQTPFYSYPWLWSLVPVTSVIACGGAVLLENRKLNPQTIGLICLCLVLLVLCASPGGGSVLGESDLLSGNGQKTETILDEVMEEGNTDSICLWAPREVMQWVRLESGDITLPYGRNLWVPELNAYSYDAPSAEAVKLFAWMLETEEADLVWEPLTTKEVLHTAVELGVNRIMLPQRVGEDFALQFQLALEELGAEKTFRVKEIQGEAYYFFYVD
jgi:hypothetical protein